MAKWIHSKCYIHACDPELHVQVLPVELSSAPFRAANMYRSSRHSLQELHSGHYQSRMAMPVSISCRQQQLVFLLAACTIYMFAALKGLLLDAALLYSSQSCMYCPKQVC